MRPQHGSGNHDGLLRPPDGMRRPTAGRGGKARDWGDRGDEKGNGVLESCHWCVVLRGECTVVYREKDK